MENLELLLRYIQKTNPKIDKEKLLQELSKSTYASKSIIFSFKNFVKTNNF